MSATKINHWDATQYGGGRANTEPYVCEIKDNRANGGQVRITLGPESGNVDDYMDVLVEVTDLPCTGTEQAPAVPCFHLALNGDTQALSVYQAGLDKLMLRLETGMRLSEVKLPSGEIAYMLEVQPLIGTD